MSSATSRYLYSRAMGAQCAHQLTHPFQRFHWCSAQAVTYREYVAIEQKNDTW
jgi:hypothetical protein